MRALLIAMVTLGAARLAHADPDQLAEAAYADGQDKYLAGDYLAAARSFEVAFEHDPVPAYLFNSAQAYRLGNECAKAAAAYRAYLDALPAAPNRHRVLDYIARQDDCAKRRAPPPKPVEVKPPAPPALDVPTRANQPTRARQIAGLVTGAVGLVALGAGAYFTRRVGELEEQREALCVAPCAWQPEYDIIAADLQRRGDQASRRAIVSYAAGGALLATGVTLYVLGRTREIPRVLVIPARDAGHVVATLRF